MMVYIVVVAFLGYNYEKRRLSARESGTRVCIIYTRVYIIKYISHEY